jgi:hypothetical protein
MNDPWTQHYYKSFIPDPTTGRLIVAPYILYHLSKSHAEVSLTYGKGYPISTRVLQPHPVPYYTPHFQPEELILLDSEAPFATAINQVVDMYFPLELTATLRHYQYFKKQQYSLQKAAKRLRDKEGEYLEKAMGALSSLENANFLGRLFCYDTDIERALEGNNEALMSFHAATRCFMGFITQNALDSKVNPFRANPNLPDKVQDDISSPSDDDDSEEGEFLRARQDDDPIAFAVEERLHQAIDKQRERRRKAIPHYIPRPDQYRPLWSTVKPWHKNKLCHKCRCKGHVRANCPVPAKALRHAKALRK